MKAEKKITVHIPEELLRVAQKQTGQGISETVRHASSWLQRETLTGGFGHSEER